MLWLMPNAKITQASAMRIYSLIVGLSLSAAKIQQKNENEGKTMKEH